MHVLNIIELSLRTQRELIVGKLANNVSVLRLMLFYFHLLLLLQRFVLFMMQSYLLGRRILREFDVTWIRPRLGGLPHLETFTWQILTPAEEGYPIWQAGQPASSGHPTYRVNVIKMKLKIIWMEGLLHLSGLPHLPGVHHFHVNRPGLGFAWRSHSQFSLPEFTYNLFSNIAAKLVEKRCYNFTTLNQICLATNQVLQAAKSCCRKERVVLLFAAKSYMLRVLLAQGQQTWRNLTPCMAWIPRNSYPIRCQCSRNMWQTDLL